MILSTACSEYLLLFTTESKQISELCQKRGFNGSTWVIECVDYDAIDTNIT